MHGASWLLIVLAFALGLVLTFALMIRRVELEVPAGSPAVVDAGEAGEPGEQTDES